MFAVLIVCLAATTDFEVAINTILQVLTTHGVGNMVVSGVTPP